jgi:hypothetical protein
MQCPPDFVGVSVITAIGATIGCKIGILPKERDDWYVVVFSRRSSWPPENASNASGFEGTASPFDGVFQAVNDGVISVAEARDFIDLLRAKHEICEAASIDQRLRALEADDA